jgi:hypothetical protein
MSRPPFATGRNSGPSEIPAAASHALTAFTGRAALPRTMAIVSPWPSWSVFDRRMVTLKAVAGKLIAEPLRNAAFSRSSACRSAVMRAASASSPTRCASAADARHEPSSTEIAVVLESEH